MITPKSLFEEIDSDGTGTLDVTEFFALIEKMNVKISEKKALKIFARCDKGGSGTLTYAEYLAAYELLIFDLAVQAVANMGLTPRRILKGLFTSAVGLMVLFIFIFLGIASFRGQGNFGSSVRSIMAAGSALGSTAGSSSKLY